MKMKYKTRIKILL